MVLRSASAFICATINNSPEPASVTTAVISPSESNLGWKASPSSISLVCSDTGSSSLVIAGRDPAIHLQLETLDGCAGQARAGRSISLARRTAQQRDETDLLLAAVAKQPGELRGDRRGARLRHPAHRHAHMLRLDHHRDAARL